MQYLPHVYPSSRPLTPPWAGTSVSLNSLCLLWIMFPDLTVEGFNWSHFLGETHKKKKEKKAVQPAILTLPLITCTLMMLRDYYWIHMSTSVSLPLDCNDVFSLWGIMIVPSSQWIFLPISLVLLIRVNSGDHTLFQARRGCLENNKGKNRSKISLKTTSGSVVIHCMVQNIIGLMDLKTVAADRHNWFPVGVKEAAKSWSFPPFVACCLLKQTLAEMQPSLLLWMYMNQTFM